MKKLTLIIPDPSALIIDSMPYTARILQGAAAPVRQDEPDVPGPAGRLCRLAGLKGTPSAALLARSRISEQAGAWIHMDPAHLIVGPHGGQLVMADSLAVTADEAQQLTRCLLPLVREIGARLHILSPQHWLLALPTPPDINTLESETANRCAAGGTPWRDILPSGPDAAVWHRLINEAQMLLHDHAINRERERCGSPIINSVWCWGGDTLSGTAPPCPWDQFHGAGTLTQALAAWYGHDCPIPTNLAAVSRQDNVLVDLSTIPDLDGNESGHWLENEWARPLWQRLRAQLPPWREGWRVDVYSGILWRRLHPLSVLFNRGRP